MPVWSTSSNLWKQLVSTAFIWQVEMVLFGVATRSVGDYPEQLLITAINVQHVQPRTTNWVIPLVLERHASLQKSSKHSTQQVRAPQLSRRHAEKLESNLCSILSGKPCRFWISTSLSLPTSFTSCTKGSSNTLTSWLKVIYGDTEIDARCRRLPPNHNIRIFMKGISHLWRVTGTEHDQILWFLLGIIIDMRLPDNMNPTCLLCAVRGM